MPITIDDVLNHLGIDYPDDMITKNINRMITVADGYLKGSIHDNYPKDDPRIKELALIIVGDLYQNRSITTSLTGNTRRLVDDLSWQLRLEIRRSENVV